MVPANAAAETVNMWVIIVSTRHRTLRNSKAKKSNQRNHNLHLRRRSILAFALSLTKAEILDLLLVLFKINQTNKKGCNRRKNIESNVSNEYICIRYIYLSRGVFKCLQMSSNGRSFTWLMTPFFRCSLFFPRPKNASEHVTFDQGQMKGQEMA